MAWLFINVLVHKTVFHSPWKPSQSIQTVNQQLFCQNMSLLYTIFDQRRVDIIDQVE